MSEPPHDEFEDELLRERIRQLRETLDALADGKAVFSEPAEDMPPEMELAFLERVLAFETAGSTTWLKRLEAKGYFMPPPESLTDDEIGLELWQVIQHLAELRVYLHNTDHLSDQELYSDLYGRILTQKTFDLELDENSACQIDPTARGGEEDRQTWFRYYAREEDRRDWMQRFPDDPIPQHEEPPYDRDRLLPKYEATEGDPFREAIEALLSHEDWSDAEGPLRLSKQIDAADLVNAPVFFNCRVLLETLRVVGRAKATSQLGDLPRAFNKKVEEQLPELPHQRLFPELCDTTNNERSLPRVHQARLLCQSAGLLRKYRGHFVLTRKGESLLDPGKAGLLYRDLFLAQFRRLSLAYFDYMPELSILQQTFALTLWRLSLVARHWLELERMPEELLLPAVLDDLYDATARYRSAEYILNVRLIEPLKKFGLVETIEEKVDYTSQTKAVRITPLFDRFLSFHLAL